MFRHFRPLDRFAVAIALALAFVGMRAGVEMSAAASTFATLPDLRFNQGQSVTVAFAAQGFPAGVTYSATGLPPGLSMSMGVDTQGHEVGILSGTLPPETAAGGGSEGVYSVRVSASDGGVSNIFSVDVSHWNHGDVFVGGGQWVYRVYRDDASFKTDVQIPDDANTTFGSTTGCAVNWHTGEVWATNFDEIYPAVNVITRHAGTNPLPYTDPSRRLSTERYGVTGALTPSPGNLNPFDINPESVTFDNAGDMLVGHSFGFFNDNGDVADSNGTPIILQSAIAGWVYVDGAGQPLHDADGQEIASSTPISPAGFFERWVSGPAPVNILDASLHAIQAPVQGGMDLHRYIPDADGNYTQTNRQFYDLSYGLTGIDTLDLLSDQTTVSYTSEDWYIRRYDIGGDKQLSVVGSAVVGESRPIDSRSHYGVRALPPGDGTGGYLVVNTSHINRLDASGQIVNTYDVKDDPDTPANPATGAGAGDVDGWFAVAIAPDARTFWAASRTDVFHFDIASGALIGQKIRARTSADATTNQAVAGLCVMDEYRAAQEVCGPTGLGNGIDDDQDGTIDEGCFRVEICSALSPGDDDGDGLVDYNDPDCGAPPSQQCVAGGPTDNSVAGICDRADYEGDTVVVPGVPLPCTLCTDWTFSYTATGLPAGLTMNATTGEVTGMPDYSIVNPNSETTPPVVFHVTVNATWQRTGAAASSFANTFDWTISNRNRVPLAVDDGTPTILTGASFSFDVRANDSDIDGDNPLAIDSFSQPPAGQGSVAQVGQNLVYTAPASGFSGFTSFTYAVRDTYNPAGVSNVATVRVRVNSLPLAANDSYVTPKNTPLAASVAGNDTPSIDGGNTWTVTSGPASGVLVLSPDGTFIYTPAPNVTGTVTFNYTLCDGDNDCANAVATIKINDVPLAADDAFTTVPNTALTAAVTGNDVPSADGVNVWAKVTDPSHGAVTMTAAGGFTYAPALNYSGLDSFTYKVCDVDNDCSIATVNIRINDVPKAVNDSYTTPVNTALTASVAGNDTPSADGGNVWTVTTPPASGTLVLTANGAFTYTPATGFAGTVTFDYNVCDVDNECAAAVATIKINDVPLAANDSYTTPKNTALAGSVAGNDTPSADGTNVWTATAPPTSGTLVLNPDGTFTYTPATGITGTVTFAYKVCDVDNDCAPAIATIKINDVPLAVNDSYTTTKNTAFTGTVAGNDTPSADGSNVWTVTTAPASGTLVLGPSGAFTYTPATGFTGTVTFTYNVCDVDNDCATAAATIKVNDVPVAVSDAFSSLQDTLIAGSLAANDTASADGGNVWTKASNPLHGTATVNADGTFLYTPAAGYYGSDVFTYMVCDVDNDCSTATVTISLVRVNHVPVASADAYTTPEDSPITGSVTGNDQISPDGGNAWTLVTGVAHGTLSFTNGTFTYTPAANYNGTDTFTYKLCDVDGDCSTAAAVITITPVNDVPVAANDAYSMAPNSSLTKDVSSNDTASGDGGNTWTQTSNPSSGTVVFNADGTFTYTPATGFSGVVSFNYKLCDANNDCSTATVTITIAVVTTGGLTSGDTATIGFWHNGNGQALIKAVNGGPSATSLGNWLASNYPYLFGANAGAANDLTGKTNAQVAAYDLVLFGSNKKMNQVLGGALAAYVTNTTLAGGNYAGGYGFNLSTAGTGTRTYNVGSNGTAIGLVNNTSYTVYQLLQQANLRKQQGTYNTNAFNVIFSGINQKGDIQ